jgi:uncharacterized repeat protein (TIGR03803 family)
MDAKNKLQQEGLAVAGTSTSARMSGAIGCANAAFMWAGVAHAATLTTVASFDGSNGSAPVGALVAAPDGTLYGTTSGGGTGAGPQPFSGAGTVFKVSNGGLLTAIYKFDGRTSAQPVPGVIAGRDGNFYGVAVRGGPAQMGIAFRVTPGGSMTPLVSFTGPNGAFPTASLVLNRDGNFYGTTLMGGTSNAGTLFRMSPSGAVTTLASFGGAQGSKPAQLVAAPDGSLYGTTLDGGTANQGSIFRATTAGTITTVASFNFASAQGDHYTTLTVEPNGALFGAAVWGGSDGKGCIYKVTPAGEITVLASFTGPNGDGPNTRLTRLPDGSYYGTTTGGGAHGKGTVFKVSPAGVITTVVSFSGPDGIEPYGPVIPMGKDLYGTTQLGGANGRGTIFRVSLN